jgi:formate dehydrogenase accessory protein FdhD
MSVQADSQRSLGSLTTSNARGPILPRLDAAKLRRHLPERRRVRIEVNGVLAGAPVAVPDAVPEFAIGWAFMQRFFSKPEQLGKISSTSSHVSIMVESGADIERIKYESIGWIVRNDLEEDLATEHSARPPRSVAIVSEMDAIATCRAAFAKFDSDGARAGYMHAALANVDEVLCIARDTETIAATQKVLGWALATSADLSASILVVRGILEAEIVESAARAGIPIVATDAVPTYEAITAAQRRCTSILGLALSHRRGLFADGGHVGDDVPVIPGSFAASDD